MTSSWDMGICQSLSAHTFWGWSGVGGPPTILSKCTFTVYESFTPLSMYYGAIKRTFFPHYWWPQVPPKAHVTSLQWRKTFVLSASTSLYKLDQSIEFGYLCRWKFGTHTSNPTEKSRYIISRIDCKNTLTVANTTTTDWLWYLEKISPWPFC